MHAATLRDATWSSRETKVATAQEALATIDRLAVAHEAASRRAAADLTPEERAARAGFSFLVTDERGQSIQVGVHADGGWVILHLRPRPMRAVPGELTGDDPVAFLFPEWTEFPRHALLPADRARELLIGWFETGQLPRPD